MSRYCMVGLVFLALAPPLAHGQDDTQYITWVRYFQTDPGKAREFTAAVKEINGPTLDGLIAEGKLLSWGILMPFTWSGDEDWTQGIWLSCADWAHMDEVMAAFEAAEKARGKLGSEAVAQKFREMIEPGSVRDEVFRNVIVPGGARTLPSGEPPAYIRVARYKVHPGREKDIMDLYRQYAQPVYERLIADGAILKSGFASREIVLDPDWSHLSWVITPDLAALDTMQSTFKKVEEARSEQEQAAFIEKIKGSIELEAYRSQILKIIHLGGKK